MNTQARDPHPVANVVHVEDVMGDVDCGSLPNRAHEVYYNYGYSAFIKYVNKMPLDIALATAVDLGCKEACHYLYFLAEQTRVPNSGELEVDTVDPTGRTTLMKVIMDHNIHVIEFVLQHSKRLRVKDEHGNTILHLSVLHSTGRFPFKMIVEHLEKEDLQTLTWLMAQFKENQNALDMAIKERNQSLAKYLIWGQMIKPSSFSECYQTIVKYRMTMVDKALQRKWPSWYQEQKELFVMHESSSPGKK